MPEPMSVFPTDDEVIDAWLSGKLDTLIEETLRPLLGEPFVEFGRAGGLAWLGFGEVVPSPARAVPDRKLARHRIHVSCPFRLDGTDGKAIAAQADFFEPGSKSDADQPDFNWDTPGGNRFDVAVTDFWRRDAANVGVVEDISADQAGGLTVLLSTRNTIRCFPNQSGRAEHWRYFRVGQSDHFVVLPEE